MVFPEIIQKEGPSPLEYAEGMAKINIGLINAYQGIGKVNLCFRKHLIEPTTGPQNQIQFNHILLVSRKLTYIAIIGFNACC